jgi:hypothetical protein
MCLQHWPWAVGAPQSLPLYEAGFFKAVVEVLKHDSPFCATAPAAALTVVGITPKAGQMLLQDSNAIPALVDLIERSPTPGDLETVTGRFRRSAPKYDYSELGLLAQSPCRGICAGTV